MRKTIIALAAVVVVGVGSTLSASARGGGGGHGGGGGGHGGMGGGGMGGMGHGGIGFGGMGRGGFAGPAMGRPGGVARVAAVHPMGLRGARVAFNNGYRFRHRFVRNRFEFVGGGYPYAYGYDDCYARVWTPWGWSWSNVCYY
jgi:hypothetical protein